MPHFGMSEMERLAFWGMQTQLNQARKTNRELHRRLQRLEGMEQHLAKVHAGYKRNEDRIRNNAARKIVYCRKQIRAAVDQIVAAGVSNLDYDRPDQPGQPRFRVGRLDVLIARLIAQRDENQLRGRVEERDYHKAIAEENRLSWVAAEGRAATAEARADTAEAALADAQRQLKIARSALEHIVKRSLWNPDRVAQVALEMMDKPEAKLP